MSETTVPIYRPVKIQVDVESVDSGLLRFFHGNYLAYADFHIPKNEKNILRFVFDQVSSSIFRILDEFPLSTEIQNPEGLVKNNLLYEVFDHPFLLQQSEAWRKVNPEIRHYQFVTGDSCLDALTPNPPSWAVVPADTPIPFDED